MDTSCMTQVLYAWDWLARGQNAIVLGIFLAGLANIIVVCFIANAAFSFDRDQVADAAVSFGQPTR